MNNERILCVFVRPGAETSSQVDSQLVGFVVHFEVIQFTRSIVIDFLPKRIDLTNPVGVFFHSILKTGFSKGRLSHCPFVSIAVIVES